MLGYFTRSISWSVLWAISATTTVVVLLQWKMLFGHVTSSELAVGEQTFAKLNGDRDVELRPIIRDEINRGHEDVEQKPVVRSEIEKGKTITLKTEKMTVKVPHHEQDAHVDPNVHQDQQQPHKDEEHLDHNSSKPTLVLFSTWMNKKGKEHVRKSILGTWRRWYPGIVPVLLADDTQVKKEAVEYQWVVRDVGETGCGNSTIPTLRGMFKVVMSEFKDKATLFGFANGDLVFDDSLELTMKSLLQSEAQEIKNRPVMILGKRINVRVEDNATLTDVSKVKSVAAKGKYPQEGSSDFFITNHLFPWDQVPEIVIGRIGFGMWIVAFARANNVTLYDVTKTVTVIHLTTHEGIFESSKSPNVWCNHQLINGRKLRPRSYNCGYIDCAGKRSVYSEDGSVKFIDVAANTMMNGCHDCGY